MKTVILVIFLLSKLSIAQTGTGSDFGRSYSDTIPGRLILDISKLREHIYSQVPEKSKQDWLERATYHFADQNAQGISNLLTSSEVYSDWSSLEEYFNEILQKVTPPELKSDTVIHAFVIQNPDFNAFMTPSGHTFIHIGLMAEVIDEASIAAILAHELAHYYLKHSLNSYIESITGNFDLGLFNSSNRLKYKYSIKNELQADSLAIRWLSKSGYNMDAMFRVFETMSRLERNFLKKEKDMWEIKETTHPVSAERYARVNKYFMDNSHIQGQNFLISQDKFKKFREESKIEILKLSLNKFEYATCTEKAFRFHLFEPDNGIYIYYLIESIRRNCYLFPELWNKNFIASSYYDSIMADGVRKKVAMESHLFKTFDTDIIPIVIEEGPQLKAKFYWRDQPKFITNEEAFNFFYKVSQKLNMKECILSNALSYTNQADRALRDKFLQAYLENENIMHREYAKNLLAGTSTQILIKKKLLLFHNFQATIRFGKEDISIPIQNGSSKNTLAAIMDSVSVHLQGRIPIFGPDIKFSRCNDYKLLSELEDFSFLYILAKGQRTELHILDPKYWEIFYKYGVNEVEFINCSYFESHPKDRSIVAYKQVVYKDFNALFSERNTEKYFDVFASSVRQIENGAMKVKHYSGQNKLTPKRDIKEQIITYIRVEIKEKDKYAQKLDFNKTK